MAIPRAEKKRMSLKSRIMISALIPVILGFFLICLVIFTSLFRMLVESARTDFLQKGQKYAADFQSRIDNATDYLSIVSSIIEMQMSSGNRDRELLQATIYKVFDDYNLIDGSSVYFEVNMFDSKDRYYAGTEYGTGQTGRICYYFYKDGEKTAYLPEALPDEIEFELPHYTLAKKLNEPIYTDPTVHKVDGKEIPMFTITCPIQNASGHFIGAITVDLFLKDIYDNLQHEEIYDSGYIVIVNGRGQIIYSPVFEHIGKMRSEAGLEYGLPEGDATISLNAKSIINGKETLLTIDSVYIDWLDSYFYISVAAPLSEINAGGMRLTGVLITLSVVIVIAIAAMIYIFVGRISRPIREITASANEIAGGAEVDAKSLVTDTKAMRSAQEIYTLSTAIKKMLTQLEEGQRLRLDALKMKHEKEKAQAQAQAKNDFLAKMSHEIRTPMNAVVGMIELILRKDLPQDVYEDALIIKAASGNLLSIINDILDFSKIESGMLELVESEYMLSSLINDVANVTRVRLIDKPLLFAVNIDPGIPDVMIGDEVRIRQVLINLLSNAVKYTNSGYIWLTVECDIKEDSAELTVIIADSGIGIKPEDIDKLFGDFVQVDTASNKGIEGTGLGLAITKNLCRLMGGNITVSSEYGHGSTFTITIPQKIGEYKPFAKVEGPEGKSVLLYETRAVYSESVEKTLQDLGVKCKVVGSIPELFGEMESFDYVFVSSFMCGSVEPALSKLKKAPKLVLLADITDTQAPKNVKLLVMPTHALSVANILNNVHDNYGDTNVTGASFTAPEARIMIVDDVLANLRVGEGLLLPYEVQVRLCQSGREALEMVRAEQFDLVFMDHMMPEMDGIEATRRIREIEGEYYQKLPIIALTANAVSGVREMFIQNGMNDFLAKPIETAKLNTILEKWIPREKRKKNEITDIQEEESSFVKALREVPELSVDKALEVVGGSVTAYERIMKVSIRLLPENIKSLSGLLETDITNYSIEVHGVKGVLNNIGAYELGRTALRLEEYSKNGDDESCRLLHPGFVEKLTDFTERVLALLDNEPVNERASGEIDELGKALTEISEDIENYDSISALRKLESLLEHTYDAQTDEKLAELQGDLELFEYEKAADIIEGLRETLLQK